MKIAVVGSGISGLLSAYLLSKQHEVHLFEANDYVGGHTHTVDVTTLSGSYAIDTGFIVFNDKTYPNFIRLLSLLGVEAQASFMSFSVKVESSGLEYNGSDLNRMFCQRSNLLRPSFYRMILDILKFNEEAPQVLALPDDELTLGQYLQDRKFSREFVEHYIVPMGAAIWSASAAQMQDFPIRYFVQFFKNHGFLSVNDRPTWRVLKGGSRAYIPHLSKPFAERIHLSSPVLKVRRDASGVFLTIGGTGGQSEVRFDQIVMASHSDQTLRMLSDASATERSVLGAFSYQENKTVLHTDTSVLPRAKAGWAAWNYLVPAQARSRVAVTYDMNILQGISSRETFCVSLNMDDHIDSSKVLRKFTYNHPVYTSAAVNAQKLWASVSGQNRVHFCGSYWGFGFHEDGVKSALKVGESLGVTL